MSFGFQRDDARFDDADFGSGDSGGFGLMPFGGGDYPVYEPPTLQYGSDDLTRRLRVMAGETVLARNGITLAARTFAVRGVWRVVWLRLTYTQTQELYPFWLARRFRLLPDAEDESTYWIVRWSGQFTPRRLKGGQDLYDMEPFELQEVP